MHGDARFFAARITDALGMNRDAAFAGDPPQRESSTLRSFLRKKRPRGAIQIAACVAYYFTHALRRAVQGCRARSPCDA